MRAGSFNPCGRDHQIFAAPFPDLDWESGQPMDVRRLGLDDKGMLGKAAFMGFEMFLAGLYRKRSR